MTVKREAGKVAVRSPERSVPPPEKKSEGTFLSSLMTLLVGVVLGAGSAF